MHDPSLWGKSAILLASRMERWKHALEFDTVVLLDEGLPAYLASGYRGPQPQ